jgi:hypothetical protein
MADLCHSYQHRVIPLRATHLYQWEEVRALCRKCTGPYSLRMEGVLIPLQNEWELRLACKVAAAYHASVAHAALEDDGFAADMAEREERIAAELAETDDSW